MKLGHLADIVDDAKRKRLDARRWKVVLHILQKSLASYKKLAGPDEI
jgi:hypothetical protein